MVDSIVVGNFVGDAALAAVGTGFPVIFMLVSLFMGLGTGATVMISQFYGAGDKESLRKTAATIYNAILVGAVPLTILGILLAGPLLRMMNVPEDAYGMARTYVMVVFAGVVGNLGYNVNAGILQGLGNSRTTLLFLSIACVINIVLDLVFVIVVSWGVMGVALATIIAQFCSWLFGIFYINKHYKEIRIRPFHWDFDRHLFGRAMKLGIPSGIQQALFSVGIMVLQTLINRYDTAFIAGFQGANKLDTFGFMPVQSFAIAVTTYVGQNIGAGKMERVNRGMWYTVAMAAAVNVVVAIFLVPLGPVCMRLFSQDPQVIAAGCAYLDRIMPFYVVFSFMFILNAVMRGGRRNHYAHDLHPDFSVAGSYPSGLFPSGSFWPGQPVLLLCDRLAGRCGAVRPLLPVWKMEEQIHCGAYINKGKPLHRLPFRGKLLISF